MRRLWKNENGSVLVLTAVAMVVILGFTALAIDGGNLYHRHMRLQDIADACSLAACQELADTGKQQKAIDEAVDYARLNDIHVENGNLPERKINYGNEAGDAGTMKVSFPTNKNKKVKVELNIKTKMYFARVLGFNDSNVAVASVAQFGVAQQQREGIFPLAIWGDSGKTNGDNIDLTFMEPTKGNFGFVYFNKPEKINNQSFKDTLKEGFMGSLEIGQVIETEPGNDMGTLITPFAVARRLIDPKDKNPGTICDCTYDDYDEDCPRVITIVSIAEKIEDSQGRSEVTITGFVKIFLDKVIPADGNEKAILKAIYIEEVDLSSPIGDGDAEGKIKGVRLVE